MMGGGESAPSSSGGRGKYGSWLRKLAQALWDVLREGRATLRKTSTPLVTLLARPSNGSSTTTITPTPMSARLAGHTLVPFVMEDGGRFGDHAIALLWNLALRGTGPRGCPSRPLAGGQSTCCPTPTLGSPRPTATASWYVNKWLGSVSWDYGAVSHVAASPDSPYLRLALMMGFSQAVSSSARLLLGFYP